MCYMSKTLHDSTSTEVASKPTSLIMDIYSLFHLVT